MFRFNVKRAVLACGFGAIAILVAGCSPGWIVAHSGAVGLQYAGNGQPGKEYLSVSASCTKRTVMIGNNIPIQSCPGAEFGELLITNTLACALIGPPFFCNPVLSIFRSNTLFGTFFPQGSCTEGPCAGRGGTLMFGVGSIAGQQAYYLYVGAQSQTEQDVSPLLLGVSAFCTSVPVCDYADLGAYVPASGMANGFQVLFLFTPGTEVSSLWTAMAKNQSIAQSLYSYMLTKSNYSTTHIIKADSFVGFTPGADYGPLGPAVVGRFFACSNSCVHVTTMPPL